MKPPLHLSSSPLRVSLLTKQFLNGLLCLSLILGIFSFIPQMYAQEGGIAPGETLTTNPKTRQTTVTATVPDNEPPTAPILISPSNGALITTSRPNFVWEASSDPQGISNYQLVLDGNVYFAYIPTTTTVMGNFTVTYDPVNDEYTLSPNDNIPDGNHTWKIIVFDNTGNSNLSATWSFTIDTQAPSFVLTQIGTTSVSISAQDISTVPVTPVAVADNEPLLVGNGEANSTVQTTLIIPGEATQYFTNQIGSNGSWSLQLGILPRNVVMTLNFMITDQAGNISVLNGVNFYIVQQTIIIPPGSPTPTPGVPASPGVSPPPSTPSTPGPSPIIEIPITPPREVIIRATQRIEPLTEIISDLPEFVKDLAPISAVIVSTLVPIISALAVASQFGGQLSLNLILRILQALGLLPAGKPQGLVFDTKNGEGVPFAVLIVTSQDLPTGDNVQLAETVITNADGVYQGLKLPSGRYSMTVTVQDYQFPTKLNRPAHLRVSDFYRGETFSLQQHEAPNFLVPVDPLTEKSRRPFSIRLKVFLARLSHYSTFLVLPLLAVSLVLAILFPSVWNWLIVAAYIMVVLIRVAKSLKRPMIVGTVISDDGQPNQNVIVRIRDVENNQLVGVSLTDKWGKFEYFGEPGLYEVSFQKQDYVWIEKGSPMSFDQVDTRTAPQQMVATLSPLSQVYQQLGM